MLTINNVESYFKPEEVERYDIHGVDYNFDIQEVEYEYEEDVKDENGNLVLNEEGEIVRETKVGIKYCYNTYRFDNEEEYNEWRENNL